MAAVENLLSQCQALAWSPRDSHGSFVGAEGKKGERTETNLMSSPLPHVSWMLNPPGEIQGQLSLSLRWKSCVHHASLNSSESHFCGCPSSENAS